MVDWTIKKVDVNDSGTPIPRDTVPVNMPWTHIIFKPYITKRLAYCFDDETKMTTWLDKQKWKNGTTFLATYAELKRQYELFKTFSKDAQTWVHKVENKLISCQTKKFRGKFPKLSIEKLTPPALDTALSAQGFPDHICKDFSGYQDWLAIHSSTIYYDRFFNPKPTANDPAPLEFSAYIDDGMTYSKLAEFYRPGPGPNPPPPAVSDSWNQAIRSIIIGTPGVVMLCDGTDFLPMQLFLWGPGSFPTLNFGAPLDFDGKAQSYQSMSAI